MPASKRNRNKPEDPAFDRLRGQIEAQRLIKRLQNHVFGKTKLSSIQLRAAEVLLRKKLPDLTSVEHSGAVETERPWIGPPPQSPEDWAADVAKDKDTRH